MRDSSSDVTLAPPIWRRRGICGGRAVFVGTRMEPAVLIVHRLFHGESTEEILRQYPHLTEAHVRSALRRAGIDDGIPIGATIRP